MYCHLHEVPQAPSVRRPDLVLPPEMDTIVLKLLEKDPAKRFASCKGLSKALQAVADVL